MKVNLTKFLSGIPARDYIFQKTPYEEQIRKAVTMIQNADCILIGAGSGLSAAAGLTYSGKRFEENFQEFIEKYGMTDMYSAGFYPFPSEEARWGYWSKHAYMNRIMPSGLPLYQELLDLVKEKNYFVLTTNVDAQFEKAGFEANRIFATQGDYGKIQCAKGCHQKTYDAIELFQTMNQARVDCRIPSDIVPHCPVCGGPMAMHLRCDQYFIEDENWHEAANRYGLYLENVLGRKTVLIELGVGFNTPTIIRYPFEKMMRAYDNLQMIRLNMDEAVVSESLGNRMIGIGGDMKKAIEDMHKNCQIPKRNTKNSEKHMSQEERLNYIVEVLKEDADDYIKMQVPKMESRRALRSLMNVRMPKRISLDFLNVQDAFLKEEAKQKGIITLQEIPTIEQEYHSSHSFADKISIWQGDITRLAVDAIVNAANSQMLGCFVPCHGCIDNAIHSASGIELRQACYDYMCNQRSKYGNDYEEPTGKTMITPGFNLPCQYVLHTVGPIVGWKLTDSLRDDLKNCYASCMETALNKGIRSIAFCCISTGEFHFPNDEAAKIAIETVSDFLKEHEDSFDRIVFNVFKDLDKEIYVEYLHQDKEILLNGYK